ncbi:MAG: S8 family serine peptidase [Planctomycetota bacterium]|jgi:subtilisin family serine protease
MIRNILQGSVIVILGVVMTVGCQQVGPLSSNVPSPNEDTDQDAASETEIFPDDGDPATAALGFVETELLVQPLPGATPIELAALYSDNGFTVLEEMPEIGMTALEVADGDLAAAATTLATSGLIEGIHKNYLLEVQQTPDDPLFTRQLYLTQVGLPEAWDESTGVEDIIIGIVDSGIEVDHPDLEGKVLDGRNMTRNSSDISDSLGHGTQVSGVAAAIADNGEGVAGVSWQSPLLVAKATNSRGQASSRYIASGILWAVGNGASVVNVSFAPLWSNAVVRAAAMQAYSRGSLVVISAGNGGRLRNSSGYAEALFVGAVNSSDQLTSFSDYGRYVDVVAPGSAIRTTGLDAAYDLVSGTSFSAPIVTGIAALAWSVNPDLRPSTIAKAVRDNAIDVGDTGEDDEYGAGVVSAAAVVDAVAGMQFEADREDPELDIDSPSNGRTIRKRTRASIVASDDWGIADVVMSIDGVPVATDIRSPYRFVIDPSKYSPGEHDVSFQATDLAGNSSDTQSISLNFAGASSGSTVPDVQFSTPASGSSVSGDVLIRATVSAGSGLSTLEWFVDGESVLVRSVSGTSSEVSYLWRTSGTTRGTHTISLMVIDRLGRQGTGTLELRK